MANERLNYIDALKTVACFMVIILHTHTLIINDNALLFENFVNISLDSYLVYISSPAVNLFGIMTGFLWYKKELHISKIINLWIIVFIYHSFFTLAFSNQISLSLFLKCFCPISSHRWWYISKYFGVLVLLPVISSFVEHTDYKKLTYLVIIIVAVYLIFSQVRDPFLLNRGYSSLWLMILALVGMYIRRFGISQVLRKNIILYYIIGYIYLLLKSESWFLIF